MDTTNRESFFNNQVSEDGKKIGENAGEVGNISDKVIFRTSLKNKSHIKVSIDTSSCSSDKNRKKRVSFTDLLRNMNETDYGGGHDGNNKDEKRLILDKRYESISGKQKDIEHDDLLTFRKNRSSEIYPSVSEKRQSFDFMMVQPPTPPNARHSIRTKFIK